MPFGLRRDEDPVNLRDLAESICTVSVALVWRVAMDRRNQVQLSAGEAER